MQAWVDKYPGWFIFSVLLFTYFAVSVVVSWWSGWRLLARQFGLRANFNGALWRAQSGQMRWLCGYRGCLTVGTNSEGLYLATFSFSSTLPSTPLHPMGRSLCCKKTSLSWNGSTFQTWKRIVNPVVDRRPASGASEWRRREWLPRRGSGFETATFVEQNRKGASAPSGQGVKSSAS
jgi:hypothetical protein